MRDNMMKIIQICYMQETMIPNYAIKYNTENYVANYR